jgi:hypothetical protein
MEALILKLEAVLGALKLLFPGFIGAFLASVTGPARDIKTRFIGFVAGFSIALYGTDPLLHFFTLNHDTYAAPAGFALGFFGMSVAEAAMKVIRETDIAGIIKSKFGGSQ